MRQQIHTSEDVLFLLSFLYQFIAACGGGKRGWHEPPGSCQRTALPFFHDFNAACGGGKRGWHEPDGSCQRTATAVLS